MIGTMRQEEEPLPYEHRKHDGVLPIIGVDTDLDPKGGMAADDEDMEIRRASRAEKDGRIERLHVFQARHADVSGAAPARPAEVALGGGNIFAELLRAVRVAGSGQVTETPYRVGVRSRRGM